MSETHLAWMSFIIIHSYPSRSANFQGQIWQRIIHALWEKRSTLLPSKPLSLHPFGNLNHAHLSSLPFRFKFANITTFEDINFKHALITTIVFTFFRNLYRQIRRRYMWEQAHNSSQATIYKFQMTSSIQGLVILYDQMPSMYLRLLLTA